MIYIRGYRELLLAHIDTEDNVLYPMADAILSEETDRELTKDFERVEEERVGHGKRTRRTRGEGDGAQTLSTPFH